jgi:hypothetical protein
MKFTVFSVTAAVCLFLLNITGHAAPITYDAVLTGPSESPPNASPGTGFAEVTIDLVAHSLIVHVNFAGLTGTTTASHIHAPTPTPLAGTAGVATQTPTFSNFPLGVTSGTFDQTFDTLMTSTWNPPYVTANGGTAAGAEAALATALSNGQAYLNIHTSTFTGGEIRGFLLPVPEPATVSLIALGALAAALARGKSKR